MDARTWPRDTTHLSCKLHYTTHIVYRHHTYPCMIERQLAHVSLMMIFCRECVRMSVWQCEPVSHNDHVRTPSRFHLPISCRPAEWRPLDLLLVQPERLVRASDANELLNRAHMLDGSDDNLAVVRADGTPMPEGVEPFAPLKKRVHALEAFASDTLGDDAHKQIRRSVIAVCNHYRSFVRVVCNYDESNPSQAYVVHTESACER
jgi:hypothetical protein